MSRDIKMPSAFSLLSKEDSSIVTISKEYESQPSYRVNSINLRGRSRSHSKAKKPGVKSIQVISGKNPASRFKKKLASQSERFAQQNTAHKRSKSHRLYFISESRDALPNEPVALVKLDLVKEKTIVNYKRVLLELENKFSQEVISRSWGGLEGQIQEQETRLKTSDKALNDALRTQIAETRDLEALGRRSNERRSTQCFQASVEAGVLCAPEQSAAAAPTSGDAAERASFAQRHAAQEAPERLPHGKPV